MRVAHTRAGGALDSERPACCLLWGCLPAEQGCDTLLHRQGAAHQLPLSVLCTSRHGCTPPPALPSRAGWPEAVLLCSATPITHLSVCLGAPSQCAGAPAPPPLQIHFVEIDIEQDPQIAENAGVNGTPTVQARAAARLRCCLPARRRSGSSRHVPAQRRQRDALSPCSHPSQAPQSPIPPLAVLQGQGAGEEHAGREDEARLPRDHRPARPRHRQRLSNPRLPPSAPAPPPGRRLPGRECISPVQQAC